MWRFAFRFYLVLMVLVTAPFPVDRLGLSKIGEWWADLWGVVVPWVTTTVLRRPLDFPRYSGGETPWDYITLGIQLVIALVIALIWTMRAKVEEDHRALDEGFRAFLRTYLAAMLFSYGAGKVFLTQFPELGPERLSEEFGEASPNGFLWAFMGFSPAYTIFTGALELLSGVLLLLRRTTVLGALIGIGVMVNVLMLNLGFDVQVRIGATSYLVGLVYLALPAVPRLIDLLLLDRQPAPPALDAILPGSRPWWVTTVAPPLLGVFLLVTTAREHYTRLHESGRLAPLPVVYGLFERVSPTGGTSDAMRRLAVGRLRATIRDSVGTLAFFGVRLDTSAGVLRLNGRDDTTDVRRYRYEFPDSQSLMLHRLDSPDSGAILLRRRPFMRYRLVSHPFHWSQRSNENR